MNSVVLSLNTLKLANTYLYKVIIFEEERYVTKFNYPNKDETFWTKIFYVSDVLIDIPSLGYKNHINLKLVPLQFIDNPKGFDTLYDINKLNKFTIAELGTTLYGQ